VHPQSLNKCGLISLWLWCDILPSVLWHCWIGGRKGKKTEWWDAGMVTCLGQGADLHMAQLMPVPLTITCSSKSRLVSTFWCRLTWVVPDKIQEGRKNGCVCVCVWCDDMEYENPKHHKTLCTSDNNNNDNNTHLMALCLGLPGWAGTRKVKLIWILLNQETVNGSDISWAICIFAPCPRQITMPTPHHSVLCRPDALPATQPTVSKHWRQFYAHQNDILSCTTKTNQQRLSVVYQILHHNTLSISCEVSSAHSFHGCVIHKSNEQLLTPPICLQFRL